MVDFFNRSNEVHQLCGQPGLATKPCLVFLVPADDLRQGVDCLGEDVGWNSTGHQNVAQLGEKAARLDRVLAAHRHLKHETQALRRLISLQLAAPVQGLVSCISNEKNATISNNLSLIWDRCYHVKSSLHLMLSLHSFEMRKLLLPSGRNRKR